MREFQTGQSALNQFGHKFLGADLNELLGFHNEVGFSHGSIDGQNPPRISEAALVLDRPCVEVSFGLSQRDDDGLRRNHNFQMASDMVIQLLEAVVEMRVIV